MAWNTPVDLGVVSGGTGSTLALIPAADIQIGTLVVIYAVNRGSPVSGTVTDTAGNSYSILGFNDFIDFSTTVNRLMMFWSVFTHVLTGGHSGGTITYTAGVGGTAGSIGGAAVSGPALIAPDSPAYATQEADSGGSTSVTTGALTPTQAGNIFFAVGVVVTPLAGVNPAFDSVVGFSNPPFTRSGYANFTFNGGAYQVNAGTGALTWNPTVSPSGTVADSWAAIMGQWRDLVGGVPVWFDMSPQAPMPPLRRIISY